MILVSFFSEDNILSDEIKICSIFEYQSNENRVFRFFGTPGIEKVIAFGFHFSNGGAVVYWSEPLTLDQRVAGSIPV